MSTRRPQPTNLRCRLCTRTLISQAADLVPHTPGPGQVAFEPRKRDPRWAVVPLTQRAGPRPGTGPAEEASSAPEDKEKEKEGDDEEKQERSGTADGQEGPSSSSSAPPPPPTRPIQTAASLTSRLPPHLAALRLGSSSPSFTTPATLAGERTTTTACSSHFVEPQPWMSALLDGGETRGRIVCPNGRCAGKLGSWDWAGAQCACGAWVTPAFALHASRVDAV
ncbi:hypothetical protein CF327_g6135 [Tilletia walkeri]|uniref:protein-tyrosine-phosphatase n=1 Tax=Tilletia walkeri TaxID=117179 RepID=A0A8X7N7K8_9BASI|nr:hypothetical protein CF327_g6135 [Tilletia walkeri]KAE8267230.1 hypothetical protein A4X09_0g5112 [Tilletia walkeri]